MEASLWDEDEGERKLPAAAGRGGREALDLPLEMGGIGDDGGCVIMPASVGVGRGLWDMVSGMGDGVGVADPLGEEP